MEFKYKPGDKVKIKSGLKEGSIYGGIMYINSMYYNTPVTIEDVTLHLKFKNREIYNIKEDGGRYLYSDEMFEPYKGEATISLTNPDSCSLIAAIESPKTHPVTINSIDDNNGFYTVTPFYAPVVNELQSVVADIHEACKEMKSHCEGMSLNDTSTIDTDSPVTIKVNKKKSKIHLNFNNNGT